MKKILLIILCLLMLSVSACGNMDMGLGNYTFHKIHCTITNECYTIQKWYNNDMGVEVKTAEYGSLYFSEGTYILVEDKCPICDKEVLGEYE